MTQSKIKEIINFEFGFQKSLITLLEASQYYTLVDYVMFRCCDVEYQMRYDISSCKYILSIYDGHGRTER